MDCGVSGRIPIQARISKLAEARIAQTDPWMSSTYTWYIITLGFYMQVPTNGSMGHGPYQGLASDLQSFDAFHNGRDGMHTGPCE